MSINPLVFESFNYNVLIMKICAIYPPDSWPNWLYEIYAYFSYATITVLFPVLAAIGLFTTDILDIHQACWNVILTVQSGALIVKAFAFVFKPQKVKRTRDSLSRGIFVSYGRFQKLIIGDTIQEYYAVFIAMATFSIVSFFAYIFQTIFSAEKKFPVNVWLPFDGFTDTRIYVGVFVYVTLGNAHGCFQNLSLDSMIVGMIFQSAAQLRILKNSLRFLGQNVEKEIRMRREFSDPEEELRSKLVYRNICMCIDHYESIFDCFESCYWNLIEERFCFDESIATYEDPATKEEKNNNFCDNMAFYDSVAIIAGRAIVTIDPLPEKPPLAIVQQPRPRLKRVGREDHKKKTRSGGSVHRIPSFVLDKPSDDSEESVAETAEEEDLRTISPVKKTVSFEHIHPKTPLTDVTDASCDTLLEPPEPVELRRKSLMERRTSKSLHLKIDYPKEVPIIRQSSVPKFFVDTPEENQTESSIFKTPLTSLQSPMVCYEGFCYDLKSVVQLECSKVNGVQYCVEVPQVHRGSSSKLYQIKEKIKLKKSKSYVGPSNIPHSNYI